MRHMVGTTWKSSMVAVQLNASYGGYYVEE